MDATDLDDAYQTCPYDPAHRILKSRMQWHLVRCRKNHKCDLSTRKTCPYDVTHIIFEQEFLYHVENCPKSGVVINYLQTKEPARELGAVSLEEIKKAEVPGKENWNEDPRVKTYDAVTEAKNRGVSIPEVGLSKAKKKQFILAERERIKKLEGEGVTFNPAPRNYKDEPEDASEVKDELTTPLRAPRTKPKAASICSNGDYMNETLNSTTRLDSVISEVNAPISTSTSVYSQENNSQLLFDKIITEAQKLTLSQSSVLSINLFNPPANGENVNDIANGLGNLQISSNYSSTSTLHNIDSNICPLDVNTCAESDQESLSSKDIIDIQNQLDVIKSMDETLEKEKAKLRNIIEKKFPKNNNDANLSRISRCAANFPKNLE